MKSKKMQLIAIAAGIVILCSGAKMAYDGWCQEATDDAYIDGNILPLRTAVTGYVSKVMFHDNQNVKKGD